MVNIRESLIKLGLHDLSLEGPEEHFFVLDPASKSVVRILLNGLNSWTGFTSKLAEISGRREFGTKTVKDAVKLVFVVKTDFNAELLENGDFRHVQYPVRGNLPNAVPLRRNGIDPEQPAYLLFAC